MNDLSKQNPAVHGGSINDSQGSNLGAGLETFSAFVAGLKQAGPLPKLEPGFNHSKRLSISVPPELKTIVTRRAQALGLSRSHYIRLLVSADVGKQI